MLSLSDHCPDLPLLFSWTRAQDDFLQWVSRFPHVQVQERPALEGRGWNVKPTILLQLLDEGHEEVLWLDSDVILNASFRPLLNGVSPHALVATEEPAWGAVEGSAPRTIGWGLEPARTLERTVNSCFLRVTCEHRSLLQAWQELLDTAEYRAAQARPWFERPMHLLGDQDLLTALLGSRDFAHVPVRLLRRGRDIVQSFDASTYTLRERLEHGLHRLPPLVHAQRSKPWHYRRTTSWAREPRRYYLMAYLELSPYTHVARQYHEHLDEPAEWMVVRTLPAKTLRLLAGGSVNLQGVPHAAVTRSMRSLRGAPVLLRRRRAGR